MCLRVLFFSPLLLHLREAARHSVVRWAFRPHRVNDILSSPSPTPFESVSSISSNCFSTSTQCCQSYKLVENGLATHRPAQQKTGPVSSTQIHMSFVRTPFVTSRLITVPSPEFRTCGLFSSSTAMCPVRTTFCSTLMMSVVSARDRAVDASHCSLQHAFDRWKKF